MNFEHDAQPRCSSFALPDALAGAAPLCGTVQRILKIGFNAGQAVYAAHPDRVFKVVVQAAVVQIDGAHNGFLPVHRSSPWRG